MDLLLYTDGVAAHYVMYEEFIYVALLNNRRKFNEDSSSKNVWHLNKFIPSAEFPKCS